MALEIPTTSEALMAAVTQGLQDSVTSLVTFIPNLVFAVLLFAIGWGIAIVAAGVLKRLLAWIQLETFLKDHKLSTAMGKVTLSNVLEKLLKYYVLLIFLQAAVSLLQLGTLSLFLNNLLGFAPALVGGAVLLAVAALGGELARIKIMEFGKAPYLQFLGSSAKAIVIFLGLVAALESIGMDVSIFKDSFITLLQGVVLAISLAIAIAFGIGGQTAAKDIVKMARGKLRF